MVLYQFYISSQLPFLKPCLSLHIVFISWFIIIWVIQFTISIWFSSKTTILNASIISGLFKKPDTHQLHFQHLIQNKLNKTCTRLINSMPWQTSGWLSNICTRILVEEDWIWNGAIRLYIYMYANEWGHTQTMVINVTSQWVTPGSHR